MKSSHPRVCCCWQSLEDLKENAMVRHECAEALGSIAKVISGNYYRFKNHVGYGQIKMLCYNE